MSSEKEYRTTFTKEGDDEMPKKCAGQCAKVLPATRFKFKYDTRDGVKGKVRNSICTNCSYSETKSRDTTFQQDCKRRLDELEKKTEEMADTLDEVSESVDSIQLLLMKLSGKVEKLRKS